MSARVVVVGAGVVGLTCAVRLAQAGYDTHVLTADMPGETTSSVAGAVWLRHLAGPVDSLRGYAVSTLRTYVEQCADAALAERAGVRLAPGALLGTAEPAWFGWLDDVGLPAPAFQADAAGTGRPGFEVTLPVIDAPRYLSWLLAQAEAAGAVLTRMPLSELPQRGVVVNATGVRAKYLVPDAEVVPVRGQTVLVANPGLSHWWVDDSGDQPAYAFPHGETVVVGGTRESGVLEPRPDPEAGKAILSRAAAVDPRLAGAEIRGARVGVRPTRSTLRVESVLEPDRLVVHCYGHGGSGWTLAWGTADEVVALAGASPLF